MAKTTSIVWLATALTLSAGPAAAQTTKNIFLDVNVGVQAASRSFVVEAASPVYLETALVTSTQKVGSGALIEAGGGYRVWRDLSIGLGFARTSDSADAAVSASIPHPIFFDRPATVNATADSLSHSETAFYLQAMWTVPVTDKIDASFGGGPAFIRVAQEVVGGATVATGTQDAVPVIEEHTDTANGFLVGADLSYLLSPRYGVGGFVRYIRGQVGIPGVPELTLGGFQVGAGVRLRF